MLEAVREGLGGSMPEGLDQLWFTEARGAYFYDFAKPIREGHTCTRVTTQPRRTHFKANLV